MSVTSIRLNDDIDKPLDLPSQKLDKSRNYLINQAIKEFLARQSTEESRWQETLEAMESIKKGQTIKADDVNAWLNSWGDKELQTPPSI